MWDNLCSSNLPEGRGISRSEGQEKVDVKVIPLTKKAIKSANEDDYIRRVIDSGNLETAARLISIEQAINEKFIGNNPGPYKIGMGDVLNISQILNVRDPVGFSKKVAQRNLVIADDGFASVLGIGRVPLAGLTQFQAEDLLYERLVLEQINPEFELYISGFNSKKIYVTNNLLTSEANPSLSSNVFQTPYTIYPHYLKEVLADAQLVLSSGLDALVILKEMIKNIVFQHVKLLKESKTN